MASPRGQPFNHASREPHHCCGDRPLHPVAGRDQQDGDGVALTCHRGEHAQTHCEIADFHSHVQANRSHSIGELLNAEQGGNGRDRFKRQRPTQQASAAAFRAQSQYKEDEPELPDRGSDDGECDRDCHENPVACLIRMLHVIGGCRHACPREAVVPDCAQSVIGPGLSPPTMDMPTNSVI